MKLCGKLPSEIKSFNTSPTSFHILRTYKNENGEIVDIGNLKKEIIDRNDQHLKSCNNDIKSHFSSHVPNPHQFKHKKKNKKVISVPKDEIYQLSICFENPIFNVDSKPQKPTKPISGSSIETNQII